MQAVANRIGLLGLERARPQVTRASRTLGRALNLFVLPQTDPTRITARIQIPHYWAVYVHDGRGPFGPRYKKFLVWFRNPKDDPRLRNGIPPVRARQLKRLTKDQWLAGLEANQIARAAGQPVPMIVTRYVSTPTPARPFFSNESALGMKGFIDTVRTTVKPQVQKYLFERATEGQAFENDAATGVLRAST